MNTRGLPAAAGARARAGLAGLHRAGARAGAGRARPRAPLHDLRQEEDLEAQRLADGLLGHAAQARHGHRHVARQARAAPARRARLRVHHLPRAL